MVFPVNKSSYFACNGGLDLVTPAITFPTGRTFDSLNYEPEISGGYRRINGYERFDGSKSPTDNARYIVLPARLTSPNVALDSIVTGGTTGKSGKLVGKVPQAGGETLLVLSQPSDSPDTFQKDEILKVGSNVIGIAAHASTIAVMPEEDAEYQLLATNDIRRNIGAVPGSGPIRGVIVLNDVVYAFRDSPDGKEGRIYRSSPSGWQQVEMLYEIQFKQGAAEIKVGDTVTNGQMGGAAASAFVVGIGVRQGVWHTTTDQAIGTLFVTAVSGTWQAGQTIQVGGVVRAVCDSMAIRVARQPGGTLEMVKHNFDGQTGTECIYGADGRNRAFQFNGHYYMPIRTGMVVDNPEHVTVHQNRLFLSFGSSVQFSGPGGPFTWSVVLGAGEFTTGDFVTCMLPMTGNSSGAAMAIFTKERVFMLYGSRADDFVLQPSIHDLGYSAGTVQAVSGTAFGLTARGIQALAATQNFGDFAFNAISGAIQPLMNKLRGNEVTSTIVRSKAQYRLYFNDGTILCVGLSDQGITGLLPLRYPIPVRCVTTHTFADGKERTFFGSDDGYIYESDKGTSFDGQEIEFWLRLGFSHQQSPRLRKRWRRAVLEAKPEGFCRVNCSYDLGYGNPEVMPPPMVLDAEMSSGVGGYWDQIDWEEFRWDGQFVSSPSITLEGTEKNLSLVFYGSRAQDAPHTLQGVTLIYSERRTER